MPIVILKMLKVLCTVCVNTGHNMRKNKTGTNSTKLLCSPLNLYRRQCEDKVAFCTMYML